MAELTETAIAKLPWRDTVRYIAAGRGLRLAVCPRGQRTWQLRTALNGRPLLVTVGHWPEMKLAQARKRAKALHAMTREGIDPRETRTTGAQVTFAVFAARWMREIVAHRRKNPAAVERLLKMDVLPVLGRMQLRKVGIAEVRSLVFHKRDRGRPAAAIKLRDLLDRLFRYAAACGLVDENPVAGLARDFVGRLRPRTRALSESELRQFFRHLPETGRVNALALELLLLTLARKGELLAARWEHVNLIDGTWEVPAADSKSGRPHMVYLSLRALEIFKELARTAPMWALNRAGSSYVLPSQASASQPMSPAVLNKAIARVKWGMPKFSPHDLRRTASTLLNEKEYNADWIEKAMNHTVRNKIRGVYNKAEYATQRRQMLTEWAEWLEGLNAGTE